MTPTRTIAGIGVGTAMLFGAVDASVLNEAPLERVETIKSERVEVRQVGNVVEATMGWKGEPGLTVKADLGEPTIAERLADKRKKEVVTEVLNDSMKIDFILNEKPDTNVFCQTIEGAEDYDFFYQPPLTPEEIADGAERPENVVGSYAVYHKTLKNHKLGETNYETGKAWHIYRPQVWSLSSSSTKEWAELNFDERNNNLCVTVPQDFLDKAEYPVRVDPTFGFTSIGGSNGAGFNSGLAFWNGHTYNPGEDGALNSISWYGSQNSGDIEMAVYKASDLSLVDYVNEFTPSGSAEWQTSSVVTGASVTNEDYVIPLATLSTGGFQYYYDSGNALNFMSRAAGGTWPANLNDDGDSVTRQVSVYATYQVTAEESVSKQDVIWFD